MEQQNQQPQNVPSSSFGLTPVHEFEKEETAESYVQGMMFSDRNSLTVGKPQDTDNGQKVDGDSMTSTEAESPGSSDAEPNPRVTRSPINAGSSDSSETEPYDRSRGKRHSPEFNINQPNIKMPKLDSHGIPDSPASPDEPSVRYVSPSDFHSFTDEPQPGPSSTHRPMSPDTPEATGGVVITDPLFILDSDEFLANIGVSPGSPTWIKIGDEPGLLRPVESTWKVYGFPLTANNSRNTQLPRLMSVESESEDERQEGPRDGDEDADDEDEDTGSENETTTDGSTESDDEIKFPEMSCRLPTMNKK